MKRILLPIDAGLLVALLAGCNVRNNPPVRPLATPPSATAPLVTAGNPAEPLVTVAPGKTASQDTAGIHSALPEAATAEGATAAP